MESEIIFNPNCQRCPRLATFLSDVRTEYPSYHGRPVAPLGVADPALLIVGLAPGMHGANATGRPFTGDFAGILLYDTLYKYGFSNKAESVSQNDGLKLKHCRITNAVKCLPPQNKPNGEEVKLCNSFLTKELSLLSANTVVLALGILAHNAILRALTLKMAAYKFSHGGLHPLDNGIWLMDSYHCSRYNTQTKRLTEAMFHRVFESIVDILKEADRISN